MQAEMKNIIIVGYPKSGNTWLTRLTAELVGCPVVGFWKEPLNDDVAREGHDRISNFRCFKAHHQLHQLSTDDDSDINHIIYMIRDPRDVAISAAHFFKFKMKNLVERTFTKVSMGKTLYDSLIYKMLFPKRYRIAKMVRTVLCGDRQFPWCAVPWKDHYKPYLDKGVLFVRYEDLLDAPEIECGKILSYLNLNRNTEYVLNAIENQSFDKKKIEFKKSGDERKANFMRVGRSGQWKRVLSKRQKDVFVRSLSRELEFFSYEPY